MKSIIKYSLLVIIGLMANLVSAQEHKVELEKGNNEQFFMRYNNALSHYDSSISIKGNFEKNNKIKFDSISFKEKNNKISFLGYSPLAFSILTEKYFSNLKTNSRLELYPDYFNRYSGKDSKNAVIKYLMLSRSNKLRLAQMSLSYCVNKSFLTNSIIVSTNLKQLSEIIESVNVELNQKIIEEINFIHSKIETQH